MSSSKISNNPNDEVLRRIKTVSSMDGLEQFAKSTERGINALKDIKRFFKLRSQIEEEYSKKLATLAKFEPTVTAGCISSTIMDAWAQVRQETAWEAGYHETLSNNLNDGIVNSIDTLVSSLEKRNTTIMTDAKHSFNNYSDSVQRLRKTRQTCERAFKDMVGDSGSRNTAGDTQKINRRVLKQSQDAIKFDREHREQVNETNSLQSTFFGSIIPKTMVEFYKMEIYRSHMLKQYFLKFLNMVYLPDNYDAEMSGLRDRLTNLSTDNEVIDFIQRIKPSVSTEANPRPFEVIDFRTAAASISVSDSSNIPSSSLLSQFPTPASSPSSSIDEKPLTPTKDKKDRLSVHIKKRWSTSFNFSSSSKKQLQFGVSLEDLMNAQRKTHPTLEIPHVLVVMKRRMIKMNAFQTEGIFRVPSRLVDIDSTKKQMNDNNFDLSLVENVHTISSLLKLWIRELPEPLIPFGMYDSVIGALNDPNELINQFFRLPVYNQRVLSYVLEIMRLCAAPENIKATLMTFDNLSTCFAPSIIRTSSLELSNAMEGLTKEISVIKLMLEVVPPLPIDDRIEPSSGSTSPQLTSTNQGSSALTPPRAGNSIPFTSPQSISAASAGSSGSNSSSRSIPTPIIQSPKSDQISSPMNTPSSPRSPSLNSQGSSSTPIDIPHGLSPSTISPNNSLVESPSLALEDYPIHEPAKHLIEDFHSNMVQLYLDVSSGAEVSAYSAMTVSYTIVKLTRWLEDFVTNTFQVDSYESLLLEIEKNNFISPPPVNFKVASSTPCLRPIELSNMIPAALKQWILIFTLVVNYASHYLCYLGGMVTGSTPKEQLQQVEDFFNRNKLITLSDVSQSSHNGIDINASIKLIYGTVEMSGSHLPETIQKQIAQHPDLTESLQLQFKQSMSLENNITNNNQQLQQPTSNPLSISSSISAQRHENTFQMEEEEVMDEQLYEEDEVQLTSSNSITPPNLLKSSLNQQDLIRQSTFLVIDKLNERKNMVVNEDWSEKEQQVALSLIAKQMQAIKVGLESFVVEIGVPVAPEVRSDEKAPTAHGQIVIFTKNFIERSTQLLRAVINSLNTLNSQLYEHLVSKLFEIKRLLEN
ncbi:RhoGAP domain-containing protein [Heterostelium album PN500]|uniref:RhoGAP domain-containing protein n=1 Tax=Heterostelium pallidum (strain ATCC 26659 / Pp 5 / PN500) TaxID=670386 RepID=D3AWV8_HETP5|nr:RhoGAP domain-containing protein [Heterostelium album PN500]EFA86781.1 RhoGAP domain-containing protein [Heterostelium album PN500]|eukprot:XP_020438885.1 RhoGAP domain-containing protein [Heterostelium album PN500]